MLRKWVKLLPYFIIEKYILGNVSVIHCKLDNDPVEAYMLRDGVFLVKSQKRVLLERKWELKKELQKIEDRLNCVCSSRGISNCPVHDSEITD